jgi:hypothetical protein
MLKNGSRPGLALGLFLWLLPATGWAQRPATPPPVVEQPDAQRTRGEISELLSRYPPSVKAVLGLDVGLLSDETFMAPYPALADFLHRHPEVARNPGFYIEAVNQYRDDPDTRERALWRETLDGFGALTAFAMGIGLLIWLIRTIVDYRRWNRLTRIQTDVHTKLLDRFTGSDELLSYIQSPAGAKFLESSPIRLDAGPKSVAAPLGRILWSVQVGVVILSAGIGLGAISGRVASEVAEPIHGFGVLAVAVGIGFLVSAGISFLISDRMGLIERPSSPHTEGLGQA